MSYELTIALKSDLAADKAKKIFGSIEEEIAKAGGKSEKMEGLGVKNLSYPIRSLAQANFSRFQLEIDPAKINTLRRQLEKEEEMLRVFVVKTEGGGK